MRSYYFPFGLAVVGNLIYHVSQKSIPKAANPFYTYVIIYAISLIVCVVGAALFPEGKSFAQTARESNWAVVAAGLAVVSIEVGFLLAYRAGWNISTAAVACSVTVTALLIPIGLVFFREQLSPRNALGLVFCVVGLILIVKH